MARHSSPRPTPNAPAAPRLGAPVLGLLGGGVPALAGVPGAGPATWGRSAAFVGGSGRAPALPTRPPSDLQPARHPSGPARSGPSQPGPSRPGPAHPGPGQPRRRTSGALTGRLAVTAVAAGAIATAGHALATDLDAPTGETRADLALTSAGSPAAGGALDAATTGVLAVSPGSDRAAAPHAASLAKARKVADAAAAREAAARAPKFVQPAQGRFTSGFGARWGTSHKGVDIANAIGTPIVSVADGTVIESGPASGFGMWVRVQLTDGTINVYGHVNRSYVTEGQKVRAGEQIAEIGNRGESTGPHLHFEVWTPGGTKINPLPWLAARGISLGAERD